jgi:membrane carboxypeptidase/penicillin-binding protein PbpC
MTMNKNGRVIQFLKPFVISLFLTKQSGAKKCYQYNMQNMDFGRNIRGVRQASLVYFNKSIEELNEEEILKLYIILDAPSRYNPITNSERLEQRLKSFIKNKE